MNARRFARLQASFAAQPDIHAEIAVLIEALEPEAKREIPVLPVAAAVAVIVGSAGPALAGQAQHVVVAGESLYRIAASELGSGSRWPEIARLNHLADPARIMVGQVLQMPTLGASRPNEVVPGRSEARPDVAAARPAADAHQLPVEIVPAGVVVERLPGRSKADLPPSAQPVSSSPNQSETNATIAGGSRAPALQTSSSRLQPAIPAPGQTRDQGTQRSPGWTGLDGLAFVVGAAAGLRLLGLTRRRRPAAKLKVVTAPVVEEAPSDIFWNSPPGSWDLQNLTASAS